MTISLPAVLEQLERADSDLAHVPAMAEGYEHVMAAQARIKALQKVFAQGSKLSELNGRRTG